MSGANASPIGRSHKVMRHWLHLALLVIASAPALLGQQLTGSEMNSARISVAAYNDGGAGQAATQVGVEWTQAVVNRGILRGSFSLVQGDGTVRTGRSFVEWHSIGSGKRNFTATAGTFLLNPSRFENRTSTIYLPSVLTQGVQTELTRGGTTFGTYAGAYVLEEGGRLLSTRTTHEKIAGAYAVRSLRRNLSIGIETDRIGHTTQLRQTVKWTPKKNMTLNGEYGIATRGTPSMHVSLEKSAGRLNWNAAYVKRGANYMPFGVLEYSADREGPSTEATFQAAGWLTLSGSFTRLRTNVARDPSLATSRSLQYNFNTGIRLPANLQLMLAHNVSVISRDRSTILPKQSLTIDSASVMHSSGMWITRVGLDQLQLTAGDKTLTRGLTLDETHIFRNGLSLSGQVRYQNSREATKHTARLSAAIRGSYEIGNRVSINLQTEFGRDIRNETLFATSNLRTNSASVAVKLPKHSELRFEYYGTRSNYLLNSESAMASALLGNIITPVLSESSRNTFYVRYQKTLRWRKETAVAGAYNSANVSLAQATGTVSGRICIDENGNKACDTGEAGIQNARVSVGERLASVTDANGLYVVSNVGVGPRTVELSIETLDAAFTPSASRHNVNVALHATTGADFTVTAASTVSGMVVQKKGNELLPLAEAAVQLQPGGRYAYTDAGGRFIISNVPQGEFHLTLVKETIPENARIVNAPPDGSITRPGGAVRDANFLVQIVETQPEIERLPAERVRISISN